MQHVTENYIKSISYINDALRGAPDVPSLFKRSIAVLKEILHCRSISLNTEQIAPPLSNVTVINDECDILVPLLFEGESLGNIVIKGHGDCTQSPQQELTILQSFFYLLQSACKRTQLKEEVYEYKESLTQRIKDSEEQIRSAYKEKDATLVALSHTIQTPLTIIKSELSALRPHLKDRGRLIEKSIETMSQFTRAMLGLAKMEGEETFTNTTTINLSNFLADFTEYITLVAKEHGITVTESIENGICIHAPQRKVHELFINIVDNAIKYMKPVGARIISITARKKGPAATICISDTGQGIHKKDLPHIFQKLYRGKTVEGTSNGSGLGLAIAKEITTKLGGTITAESTIGKGTMIIITLPQHSES